MPGRLTDNSTPSPTPAALPPSLLATSTSVIDLLTRIAVAVESDPPEGMRAEQAAAFICVSRSAFYELDSRGLVPRGVQIGDSTVKVWLRSELKAWLRAGAPTRVTWAQIREQQMRQPSDRGRAA